MAVECRGLNAGMPHQLLDRCHANAQLILASGECPPPCVAARINACCAVDRLHPRAQRDRAHVLARARAAYQGRTVRQIS